MIIKISPIVIEISPSPEIKQLPVLAIGPVSNKPTGQPGGGHMLAVLTDTQQVVVTYGGPVDAAGKPAPVQGLTFISSDPTAATFVQGVPDSTGVVGPDPANDGMIRGTVVAKAAGLCNVWIDADADMGDGVTLIHGEKVSVQVTAQEAVGFGSPTVGTPTEQPKAATGAAVAFGKPSVG